MDNYDEWTAFANLLGDLIAKYADRLDMDAMPLPCSASGKTASSKATNEYGDILVKNLPK